MQKTLKIRFSHGLGDCVYFTHLLELYTRRGYDIALHVNRDRWPLFKENHVTLLEHLPEDAARVEWSEGLQVEQLRDDRFWLCNKCMTNFIRPPMALNEDLEVLWEELCKVQIDLVKHTPESVRREIGAFVASLPRPLILLHTIGNSFQKTKSLRPDKTVQLYRELLNHTDGTLLLLDWDNRVPKFSSYRVRHLTDDWRKLDLQELIYLIHLADLLIGIDSGPLHAARFTQTPVLGIFEEKYHHPIRMLLPRERQVNMFPKMPGIFPVDRRARLAFNIVTWDGPPDIPAEMIREYALKLLAKPRYLDEERKGKDVALQQFVLDYEMGFKRDSLLVDRHKSFDLVLQTLKNFGEATLVETGCIRAEEDWRGAGYSTYLLGFACELFGGRFYSVDHSERNVGFARNTVRNFARTTVVLSDSVKFLTEFQEVIDLLLLDSRDTHEKDAAQHALREAQAAHAKLSERAIVIVDDAWYERRAFRGKGQLVVPWLLENGWQILYSGYQTVLRRSRN